MNTIDLRQLADTLGTSDPELASEWSRYLGAGLASAVRVTLAQQGLTEETWIATLIDAGNNRQITQLNEQLALLQSRMGMFERVLDALTSGIPAHWVTDYEEEHDWSS